MSNFFSSNPNNNIGISNDLDTVLKEAESEKSLNEQYNDIKQNYEQIFIEAAESIRKELDKFKPENPCTSCSVKDCKIEKKDIFAPFPPMCKYRDWQMQALAYLSSDYRQKLKNEYKSMMEKKNEYECNKCAACCKLAVSEFSYEQLKQKAMRGDKYATDFVAVFVPFEKEADAKAVNPEYFELLNKLVSDEKIYYYYCPKLDGNLCSIYDKRPNICKEFPHNPLKLLPSECSFNAWKNDISHQAMLLKAKVDILDYYKEKLQ